MTRVTTTELRKDISTVLNRVAFGGERIILERSNKAIAAVVSIRDLELLSKLEDAVDLADARKAMKEPGRNIPLAKVKKELGL